MSWISDFMKNSNYSIYSTKSDGNCFFECLERSIAMSNIDFKLKTINDFRKYLKSIVTEEYYNDQIEIFNMLKMVDPNADSLTEFLYLDRNNLNTFKKFKDFILTKNFWANNWAINELEKKLNIKIIILSEDQYSQGNLDNVIQCTNTDSKNITQCKICRLIKQEKLNKTEMEKYRKIHIQKGITEHYWEDKSIEQKLLPRGYVIVTYTGAHYEIIAYKGEYLFKKAENLPEDLKKLIKKKCPTMISFKTENKIVRTSNSSTKTSPNKKTKKVRFRFYKTVKKKKKKLTSHPPKKWSPIHNSYTKKNKKMVRTQTNSYLKDYVSKPYLKYKNLENAKKDGLMNNRVGGITMSGKTKKYTLRKGNTLMKSPVGEISWLKI